MVNILSRPHLVLTDIGYEGAAVLEIEDKAFESSKERIIDSIHLARDYMRQFVI